MTPLSVSDYDTISTTEAVVVELQPASWLGIKPPQLYPANVITAGSLTMALVTVNK